ncbi:MAG: hypothetical protein IKY74_02865 [Alistipes sp.]|nr:hypothetical protein [Alistipes sp.]
MKKEVVNNITSDELVAAIIDGNTDITNQEFMMVIDALNNDEDLRSIMSIALDAENEFSDVDFNREG